MNYQAMYNKTIEHYYRLNRNRGFCKIKAQRVAEYYAENWMRNIYGWTA
jgi:hypothetical protein